MYWGSDARSSSNWRGAGGGGVSVGVSKDAGPENQYIMIHDVQVYQYC